MTGSTFDVRGVVEGFYGRPWTHEQRLDLVEFIGSRGMNTFVYAPKDDPLIRRGWRSPYEGADLDRLGELVERCRRHTVDLVYCVSPGLSIQYSSDADIEVLVAKLNSVRSLGVDRFGLLLDDIPLTLQHEEDRRAFGSLVEAHAALIERVFRQLDGTASLVVCPTVYRGFGDESYIATLGQSIDPRIDLFWTGRRICSPTLDLLDAATFARATGRPATYWDNYPVNDVAMTHELHVGPYRGRDAHLWRFSRGVIANGMDRFESSKIAFGTIADYLADPAGYEPEASWARAIRDVAGDADAEAYAVFADNVRSSCLTEDDAPRVTTALEAFAFGIEYGDSGAAVRTLTGEAARLLAATDHLLRGPVRNRALIDEARPWIESVEIGARALQRLAELAAVHQLESDGPHELAPYLREMRDRRVRVFGDALDMTLADIVEPPLPVQSPVAPGGGRT